MLRKYIIFAVIATFCNLALQKATLMVYTGAFDLFVAMFVGTLAGLLLKYVLDKRYVFSYSSDSMQQEGSTFTLYTLMGVFTTMVFWVVEAAFDFMLPHYDWAKYLGATVGLGIGYTIKYFLDRRFVFK